LARDLPGPGRRVRGDLREHAAVRAGQGQPAGAAGRGQDRPGPVPGRGQPDGRSARLTRAAGFPPGSGRYHEPRCAGTRAITGRQATRSSAKTTKTRASTAPGEGDCAMIVAVAETATICPTCRPVERS